MNLEDDISLLSQRGVEADEKPGNDTADYEWNETGERKTIEDSIKGVDAQPGDKTERKIEHKGSSWLD